MKHSIVILVALCLITACSQSATPAPSTIDIEATVNARVQSTQLAATLTAQAATLAPSSTPLHPTVTFTPSPLPSTATSTPDSRLFWDDFEEGIKPDWNMTGDNYASVNGKLIASGFLEGSIGGNTWTDYRISLIEGNYHFYVPALNVLLRVQDSDNYMKLLCESRGDGNGYYGCDFFKILNGNEIKIPGSPFDPFPNDDFGVQTLQIEVEGSEYRVIHNTDVIFRFTDNTFDSGGVILRYQKGRGGEFELEGFEVTSIETTASTEPNVTATPITLLFRDDFEGGIKPEWGMVGDRFASVNGKLIASGFLEGSIGDSSWTNYRVSIIRGEYHFYVPSLNILLRVQDKENYMKLLCESRGDGNGHYECDFLKVVNGEEMKILGSPFDPFPNDRFGTQTFHVEVEGDVYRVIFEGDSVFRFTDSTFSNGGVIFQLQEGRKGELAIDASEITSLP
jgi:hypothetical protein